MLKLTEEQLSVVLYNLVAPYQGKQMQDSVQLIKEAREALIESYPDLKVNLSYTKSTGDHSLDIHCDGVKTITVFTTEPTSNL